MKIPALVRRALALVFVLFVVIALVTGAFSAWTLDTQLVAEYRSKGVAIAESISTSSEDMFLNRDASTIQAVLDQFRRIRGVSYVFVEDAKGEVIAHTFVPEVPAQVLADIAARAAPPQKVEIRETRFDGTGRFLDISSPILGGLVGQVHVGMDLGLIRAEIRWATLRLLGLLAAVLLACMGAVYVLSLRVSRPLRQLAGYAGRLAKQEFDAPLEVDARAEDEIGKLASTMGQMAQELNRAREALEERVRQRTAELATTNEALQIEVGQRKQAHEEISNLVTKLEARTAFIREIFGRYLSDSVVDNILASPEALAIGGENRQVTVLMADLRGFSSLAERLAPTQVISLLNNYLSVMTDVVCKHGGTIDEFIGDAILVLFGAPTRKPDDPLRSVACAVEMQLAMREVNARNSAQGIPPIEIGIGLDTGEVVVGNIGSERRAKYGVVGRHVNIASRIQSYTVGGQILISQSTLVAAGSTIRVNGHLDVLPKGSKMPMRIYDIGGVAGDYGLELPKFSSEPLALASPLPVRFAILDGTSVTPADRTGHLTHLSTRQARLMTDSPVPALETVAFAFPGLSVPADVYAKVVAVGAGDHLVRFTSIDPAAASAISKLLEAGEGA